MHIVMTLNLRRYSTTTITTTTTTMTSTTDRLKASVPLLYASIACPANQYRLVPQTD